MSNGKNVIRIRQFVRLCAYTIKKYVFFIKIISRLIRNCKSTGRKSACVPAPFFRYGQPCFHMHSTGVGSTVNGTQSEGRILEMFALTDSKPQKALTVRRYVPQKKKSSDFVAARFCRVSAELHRKPENGTVTWQS